MAIKPVIPVQALINATTVNVSASTIYGNVDHAPKTYSATITGSGAVSATVTILAGHVEDSTKMAVIHTLSLSGTGSDIKLATPLTAGYPFVAAAVASITGTSATVSVYQGA